MSLGLVAYGSSDESDNEEEVSEPSIPVVHKTEKSVVTNSDSEKYVKDSNKICGAVLGSSSTASETSSKDRLCSVILNGASDKIVDDDDTVLNGSVNLTEDETPLSLPAPKTNKLHDIDFDWSRLTRKKPNQPIKITVPSLNDLDSEETAEPVKKKIKPSKAGSGLFALLPSPKNSSTSTEKLKPQQLRNKVTMNPPKKSIPAPKAAFNSKENNLRPKSNASLSIDYDSPEEDEPTESSSKIDFFSLSTPVIAPEVQVPEYVDKFIQSVERASSSKSQRTIQEERKIQSHGLVNHSPAMPQGTVSDIPSAGSSESYIPFQRNEEARDLELDDIALQRLCGPQKRKGGPSVQMIDINGDAILPDAREWMTKQLTEEQNVSVHSHKKKDGPTTQQRRKHQITYLAFQAKENELELKKQWSNNRMSRKQTQAKYGF